MIMPKEIFNSWMKFCNSFHWMHRKSVVPVNEGFNFDTNESLKFFKEFREEIKEQLSECDKFIHYFTSINNDDEKFHSCSSNKEEREFQILKDMSNEDYLKKYSK